MLEQELGHDDGANLITETKNEPLERDGLLAAGNGLLDGKPAVSRIHTHTQEIARPPRLVRTELGRSFQQAVSAHQWTIAETLIPLFDRQRLNDGWIKPQRGLDGASASAQATLSKSAYALSDGGQASNEAEATFSYMDIKEQKSLNIEAQLIQDLPQAKAEVSMLTYPSGTDTCAIGLPLLPDNEEEDIILTFLAGIYSAENSRATFLHEDPLGDDNPAEEPTINGFLDAPTNVFPADNAQVTSRALTNSQFGSFKFPLPKPIDASFVSHMTSWRSNQSSSMALTTFSNGPSHTLGVVCGDNMKPAKMLHPRKGAEILHNNMLQFQRASSQKSLSHSPFTTTHGSTHLPLLLDPGGKPCDSLSLSSTTTLFPSMTLLLQQMAIYIYLDAHSIYFLGMQSSMLSSSSTSSLNIDRSMLSLRLRGRKGGVQAHESINEANQQKLYKARTKTKAELRSFFILKSTIDPG